MKRVGGSIFASLLLLLVSDIALAKEPSVWPGLAACGACGMIPILITAVLVICGIVILVWVAKDSKRRGMDNPALWMILVLFTSWVGLLVYILTRPKGNLMECPNCKEKKLETLKKCPHCGHEG